MLSCQVQKFKMLNYFQRDINYNIKYHIQTIQIHIRKQMQKTFKSDVQTLKFVDWKDSLNAALNKVELLENVQSSIKLIDYYNLDKPFKHNVQ